MPPTLAVRAFNKWLKDLNLLGSKRKVLTDNIAKTEAWWANQPAEALETTERLALCDLGAPGWGEPWFPHSAVLLVALLTTLVWRFLCCCGSVLLFCFPPYPIAR